MHSYMFKLFIYLYFSSRSVHGLMELTNHVRVYVMLFFHVCLQKAQIKIYGLFTLSKLDFLEQSFSPLFAFQEKNMKGYT